MQILFEIDWMIDKLKILSIVNKYLDTSRYYSKYTVYVIPEDV